MRCPEYHVADCTIFADCQGKPHVRVQHTPVLHVAILTHQDQLIVPAQRCAKPYTRALVELHVTNYDGVGRHPGIAADPGHDRAQAVDSHPPAAEASHTATRQGAAARLCNLWIRLADDPSRILFSRARDQPHHIASFLRRGFFRSVKHHYKANIP
jgi:hypothetical protein